MNTATNSPNIETLEHLKRVIRDAPDDLFDMNYFTLHINCGTSHCAAGWAAVDPWFQENTPILEGFTRLGNCVCCGNANVVLERTFGLSEDEVSSIFYATDATKEEVIATIDRIIAGAGE